MPFIHKYAVRFGPSTAALILAQTLCYPFDTVKRRMQLNGSIGHKNLYRNDIHCFQTMWREEGVRAFYGGFTANMARCVPQVMIQYIMFQAFRFMTRVKSEQRARE